MVEEHETDLLEELLAPIPRKAVVPAVEATLGVTRKQADAIVQGFDDYVARSLEANLKRCGDATLRVAIRSSTRLVAASIPEQTLRLLP
jgi:hypothetical protein